MNRKQIIKSALELLYDVLMKDSPYLDYSHFPLRHDIDFDISKYNIEDKLYKIYSNRNFYSYKDWQKQLKKDIEDGKIEKMTKEMHLTTFDEFDGSCKLVYQKNVVFWDTPEQMVEEFIDAVGKEFYDQIIALLILKSYDHTKLIRKGETINGK